MIYLASPYSGSDEERQQRFSQTVLFVEKALKQKFCVFSPIVYGHQFADSIGTSAAAWREFNHYMMDAASRMWVLTLPGWKTSKGVQQEIASWEFIKNTRPVYKNL